MALARLYRDGNFVGDVWVVGRSMFCARVLLVVYSLFFLAVYS